jgi:hypothetical protein
MDAGLPNPDFQQTRLKNIAAPGVPRRLALIATFSLGKRRRVMSALGLNEAAQGNMG